MLGAKESNDPGWLEVCGCMLKITILDTVGTLILTDLIMVFSCKDIALMMQHSCIKLHRQKM